MGSSTKLFRMMPWIGGVNTSLNPAVINPGELVQGDNIIFASRTSRRIREGINFNWDDATADTEDIIGFTEFWYVSGNVKTSVRVGVSTDGNIYKYTSGGTRTQITDSGTAYADPITKASFEKFNNKLIICVDGYNNTTKYWDGSGDVLDLPGGAPRASICRRHQGRLFLNDKTDKDRLHYCTTANHEEWQGVGDSGAIPVEPGDGDPVGLTAIFPTFKGNLIVGKSRYLYRIQGYTPETWIITELSGGIGCLSHNSVAPVDNDDIVFISERGVHSLVATDAYGDLADQFLSRDIHPTFQNQFDKNELDKCWGGYLPEIQSVMFTFKDSDFTGNYMNSIWFYNVEWKRWYRWPDVACQSLAIVKDSDRTRMYLGGVNNRVAQTQTGDFNDVDADGNDVAVRMLIKTGIIFPENEYIIKGFKKLSIMFQPENTHAIQASFKIDNYQTQNLAYSAQISSDLLGVDFVLGQSTLGFDILLAPYTLPIDGYGRGFQLTLEHNSIDQFVEIQGFSVEYEVGGTGQEVVVPED